MLSGVPSLAAADLGKTEWERRLIRELWGRHYRWRTEQTYREWARRFVGWLAARGGRWETAAEAEVKEFLSDLATRRLEMKEAGLIPDLPLTPMAMAISDCGA